MSGGGSTWDPLPPEPPPPTPCERIIFRTYLNSVHPSVATNVHVGDRLTVEEEDLSVVVVTGGGATLGAITSTEVTRLRECLRAGYTYAAAIMSIRGARIEIRVSQGEV